MFHFCSSQSKKSLVIGGGDGGTAQRYLDILVLKNVYSGTDKMVVDASIAHLPITACAFENPKLELHIDDAKICKKHERKV